MITKRLIGCSDIMHVMSLSNRLQLYIGEERIVGGMLLRWGGGGGLYNDFQRGKEKEGLSEKAERIWG